MSNYTYFIVGVSSILCLLIQVAIFVLFNKSKGRSLQYVYDRDGVIILFAFIAFYGNAIFFSILYNDLNFLLYYFSFSLIALLLEYSLGWMYYQLFGARLYRYYNNDLLGFSSLKMLPYWGGASVYFLFMWNIFKFNISVNNLNFYILYYLAFMSAMALCLIIIFSFIDLFNRKVKKLKKWSLNKYIIVSLPFSFGVIGSLLYTNNFYIFPYFIISTLIGFFFEGILGLSLRKLHGEFSWRYYREPSFKGGSTILAIPFWIGANYLAFILFLISGVV